MEKDFPAKEDPRVDPSSVPKECPRVDPILCRRDSSTLRVEYSQSGKFPLHPVPVPHQAPCHMCMIDSQVADGDMEIGRLHVGRCVWVVVCVCVFVFSSACAVLWVGLGVTM